MHSLITPTQTPDWSPHEAVIEVFYTIYSQKLAEKKNIWFTTVIF